MSRLVIIGNFDGVHRGHQHMVSGAIADARHEGVQPTLLTFDPHPALVVGRSAPPILTTLPRKRELLRQLWPELDLHVWPFTQATANLAPEDFARDILAGALNARFVRVGENFRFGKGRAGDWGQLKALGARFGFNVSSLALVGDAQGPWSSTRARASIATGDVVGARGILGRPHMLSGTVETGAQRGRTLGFPTANLPRTPCMLPPNGVYAALVDVEKGETPIALGHAVLNIGIRPSLTEPTPAPLTEVHIIGASNNLDLYGQNLRVHLVHFLRPERRFDGLPALTAQIAADTAQASALLGAEFSTRPVTPAWF